MILTTDERWRRYQRDLAAYRRRSLARRLYPRFLQDLSITPHLFLLPGRITMAPLLASAEEVREALSGRAIWTLDTAARRVTGQGIFRAADLTAYLPARALSEIQEVGKVGAAQEAGITLEPLYRRPPMLFAHDPGELVVPSVEIADGERVVPWDFLARDVMGTVGWRPDLLTALEASYPAALAALATEPGGAAGRAAPARV